MGSAIPFFPFGQPGTKKPARFEIASSGVTGFNAENPLNDMLPIWQTKETQKNI
jgi:hypothetical protein